MIALDTVRLTMPEHAARPSPRLATHPETRADLRPRAARPVDTLTLSGNEHLGFGFGRLAHDRLGGLVRAELSAKVLGADYLRGITRETAAAAADALTRSGFLDVTPEALLGADVTRADAFVNLSRGPELGDDFAALRTLGTHPRWKLTKAGRSPSTSLRWNGRGGTLRAYDKGAELGAVRNRAFVRTLPPSVQAEAVGLVRFEREAAGNAKARALASVAVHETCATLGTVLASTRPAVAETFGDVRRPAAQAELFADAERYAEAVAAELELNPGKRLVGEVWRRFGLATFVAAVEGDAEAVREWLRRYGGPKASELYPEAEAACRAYLSGPDHARKCRADARLDVLAALLADAA